MSTYLTLESEPGPSLPGEDEFAFWEVSIGAFDGLLSSFERDCVLREPSPPDSRVPLAERTAQFGMGVIRLARKVPVDPVTKRPIEQFVGSGTSVGANYCEANDSISAKDFRHRISICRKEAKETCFWLRILVTACPSVRDEARVLWREATELNLIFSSIWRKTGR